MKPVKKECGAKGKSGKKKKRPKTEKEQTFEQWLKGRGSWRIPREFDRSLDVRLWHRNGMPVRTAITSYRRQVEIVQLFAKVDWTAVRNQHVEEVRDVIKHLGNPFRR